MQASSGHAMRHAIDEIPLHLVTAPVPDGKGALRDAVREAILGGLRLVQYRDKRASDAAATREARDLVALCRPRGVIVIIDDRLDVALAAGADGVHLGAKDLPWPECRRLAPRPFLLGCTAATPERVREAIAAGADYAGAGPAHPTSTKPDTGPRLADDDYRALARACEARAGRPLPLVAVGGIRPGRAGALVRAGATAVAVSAGILDASDPREATRSLIDEVMAARREATA